MAGEDFPLAVSCAQLHDERHQNPMLADAFLEILLILEISIQAAVDGEA
jgi:hypothetical protein